MKVVKIAFNLYPDVGYWFSIPYTADKSDDENCTVGFDTLVTNIRIGEPLCVLSRLDNKPYLINFKNVLTVEFVSITVEDLTTVEELNDSDRQKEL